MPQSLTDPANAAALWSAIAATFAAIAAFLTWLAQIQTLKHTFRPEIALVGWSRETDSASDEDIVRIGSITNIGRDSARQVVINGAALAKDGKPTYVLSTTILPSLAAGTATEVDLPIYLYWENVPDRRPAGLLIFLEVSIWYWDALNVRHITKVSIMVTKDPTAPVAAAPRLAPGLYAGAISTSSEAVWRLRLRRNLARIPFVGRLFGIEA